MLIHLTSLAALWSMFAMEKGWLGLPYYRISEVYAKRFGEKVYKIPVSVVDDCPNRRGLKGMETCIFCDEWGSAANSESLTLPLGEQIEKYHERISKKYKAKKFLVYFQAYTNTFAKLSQLQENFSVALNYPFVHGIVVGTRPDCLSPALFKLWQETHEKSFVAVELGVQSFFDEHLQFMKRGHSREQSLKAIHNIAKHTSVDLGLHLIFGSPNETSEQIIETAEIINNLPISNVKLHNLHVLKNTPLVDLYNQGQFKPLELAEYIDRVKLFLQHLSPRIAIHRLAAYSSRWDELIAPQWTADKMGTHQAIIDRLREGQIFQGQLYHPQNPEEEMLWNLMQKRSQSYLEPHQV